MPNKDSDKASEKDKLEAEVIIDEKEINGAEEEKEKATISGMKIIGSEYPKLGQSWFCVLHQEKSKKVWKRQGRTHTS